MESVEPEEVDVDRWCITLFPHQLLTTYGHSSSCFSLANHAPQIQDNPRYKEWVYIARNTIYLLVPPSFKEELIEQLHKRLYVLLASSYGRTLTQGQHTITLGTLVEVLEAVGCTSVRLQAHGMKHRLATHYPLHLQEEELHPLSNTNLFDIGRTVEAPDVYTFKPKAGQRGFRVYDMFLPLGEGYGSVQCLVQHENQGLRIKIYPRLIHMIKAKGNRFSRLDPLTLKTAKTRAKAVEAFAQDMATYHQLGGYRIEVSVRASTLLEAVQILETTPLLVLDSWAARLDVRQLSVEAIQAN